MHVSPKLIELFVDISFLSLHFLYVWRSEQEVIFSLSGFFSLIQVGAAPLHDHRLPFESEHEYSTRWETTWVWEGGEEQFN